MTEKCGFRKRRLTPAQRRKVVSDKIKSGEIADPKVGPEPHREYSSTNAHVIEVPVATGEGAGRVAGKE